MSRVLDEVPRNVVVYSTLMPHSESLKVLESWRASNCIDVASSGLCPGEPYLLSYNSFHSLGAVFTHTYFFRF